MCIITRGTVVSTSIVVAPLKNGRHFTLYENTVELPKKSHYYPFDVSKPVTTEEGASMILPFPGKDCEMFDFANVGVFDIFDRLKQSFPLEVPKPATFGFGGPTLGGTFSVTLEVKECGSYQYSVAPTIDDLERLDKETFYLDHKTISYVKQHYASQAWGFLVCKLIPGKEKRHIAYTYTPVIKHTVFVPTRHYHGAIENRPHWDHRIYAINAVLPWPVVADTGYKRGDMAISGENRIAWLQKGQGFPEELGDIEHVSVLRIDGPDENGDHYADIGSRDNAVKWMAQCKQQEAEAARKKEADEQAMRQALYSQVRRLQAPFGQPFVQMGTGHYPYPAPALSVRPVFATDGEEVVPYFYARDAQGLIEPKFWVPKTYLEKKPPSAPDLSGLSDAHARQGVAFSLPK
jgi:hypothetical protein